MIRDVAGLLRALQEAEAQQIDQAGITHAPTIGEMYEGLTEAILGKLIPVAADLRVVSGFVEDVSGGGLSGQIDSMLVSGKGRRIPHTRHFKWPVKDVIAVLEVKKRLFSSEMADAHGHLRDVLDRYWRYVEQSKGLTFDVESALYAYGQITGSVAPDRKDLEKLPLHLEMIYRSLVVEQISPIRIIFGYSGFSSEFSFRQGFCRLIKDGSTLKKANMIFWSTLLLSAPKVIAQQPNDGLQLNVPYVCSNGQTYVVHRCATGPKGEFCFYQAEGQSERYNTRAAVAYQMTQTCKVKASAGGATATKPPNTSPSSGLQVNTPYQCPGGLILTVFQCQRQGSQEACFVRAEQNGKFITQVPKPRAEIATQLQACKAGTPFSPPYIAEFPSAYRVVQGMNVGNPAENVKRAIGAFYQLSEILKVLAAQRAPTSDEQKLLNDYSRISAVLAQGAAQKFPNEHFDPAANPYRYSPSDPKFGFEGIPVWTTFLSPSIQAQYAQIVGGGNPQYQAAVGQEKRKAFQQVQADTQAAQAEQAEANMPKDAGSVAMRRCLEAGRSGTECLGEGWKVGMNELTGGLSGELDKMTTPPPGLRLSGNFSDPGFSISFDDKRATIFCGALDPVYATYNIERGPQVRVKVSVSPQTIVATLRADGKLVGPGTVQVAGVVPVGGGGGAGPNASAYDLHSPTTTQEKQISAGEAWQYSADQVHRNGSDYSVTTQTPSSSSDTSWAKPRAARPVVGKTERCNVATLIGTPVTKMSAAINQLTGSSAHKGDTIPVGLRLFGRYESKNGLNIDFEGDLATLECGRARSAESYLVENSSGHITIQVKNEAGAFSLTLQPDGTLTGSGSVDVGGKILAGTHGDQMTYVPANGRCAVGTLTAKAIQ
ncbi:MAG TPA: DUF6602 domain-containing protein [Candidatus Binatia bacterium]|nr:DUF6602 domain-containing protein [Candidatus Binatia bacterium]